VLLEFLQAQLQLARDRDVHNSPDQTSSPTE
jgi:hypothetical protein